MGAELSRLLEAEQTFTARVDAARREARALVETAQREAEALGSDSAEALTRARELLAAEEERALAGELIGLEAETSDRVRRCSAVDDAQVASLADQLLRVLLEGGNS